MSSSPIVLSGGQLGPLGRGTPPLRALRRRGCWKPWHRCLTRGIGAGSVLAWRRSWAWLCARRWPGAFLYGDRGMGCRRPAAAQGRSWAALSRTW